MKKNNNIRNNNINNSNFGVNPNSNKELLENELHFIVHITYRIIKFILFTLFKIPAIIILWLFKPEKSKLILKNTITEFDHIALDIVKWLFAARATLSIAFVLIIIFLLQIFIFKNFGTQYAMVSSDLTTISTFVFIITSIFFHGSFAHLGGNLFALFIFGRKVEKYFHYNTISIFLIAGIIANVISGFIGLQMGNNVPSWGASGGIAGLIMLAILLEPFAISLLTGFPIPYFILGWLSIFSDLLMFNAQDGIDHFAHLGGYFGVLLFVVFFNKSNKKKVLVGLLINILMILVSFYFGLFNL